METPLVLAPSPAPTVRNGFAGLARFFPPGREVLASIDDELMRLALGEASGRALVFELIFAVDIPTTIPRIGTTFEASFAPFADDNDVQLEVELNIDLFGTEQTGGWVSSHFDIVDQFSPAETPDATRAYTHKLDFEWDTAFHVFSRLPEGHWLRNVEAEISLDYLATGLPKAGDLIGGERFLDDASPWSLSFVMVIPLAPLAP
jgi:hypothetical protein